MIARLRVSHSLLPSIAIDCGSPGNLDNGIITPGDNTSLGATVTFTCNSGYTLQGMNSRTCQSNGRWNNEVPVCQGTYIQIVEGC